ncbi:EAL domain-containing protein, partial [Ruminococcaceae bacterium OttesenSCG-928-I18]|nr:EAL domain-containing protein [Ruminococcaceae bacterium OttesenSCG-928-I18]
MKHTVDTCQVIFTDHPCCSSFANAINEMIKETDSISLLCYDIQSLRKVNRAYGRKVGGALLAAVAEWALDLPDGMLYRVESDQFCVLFKNTSVDIVQQYAFSMEARFAKPWMLIVDGNTYDIFVQASIAVLGGLEGESSDELFELMEQALDISKKEHQVILFTTEQDTLTREQVRLQMELKSCILSDMKGFHLEFQPLVDPVTRTWRGLEALCRWEGPTSGTVPPGIFIEEVEDMGLIHQVGTWVLNKAIETCKAMRLDKIDQFFVSVNVSALQMNRHNFVRTVIDALEDYQYPPDKLVLEITESTQFSFNTATTNAINMLRIKGVKFALDDFGSGYSGFSNLKNLPADMLKTDREFTENIENDKYLQYFYYIMSETAHANKMKLVAEGIETQEQLTSVIKNGADIIQGYLFGKPMDSTTIGHLRDNFLTPLPQFNMNMPELLDFKQWMSSQNAYIITPSLFGLLSNCIDHIWNENNVEDALYKIMETVGTHFNVSRVYVFLREEGTIFSEKSEWCAEGVPSQKHIFQKMDASLDGFYHLLQKKEVVLATEEAHLPENLRGRLNEVNKHDEVKSIVAMPMKKRGEILGFVGYDSLTERSWLPEELIVLHNICLLCL